MSHNDTTNWERWQGCLLIARRGGAVEYQLRPTVDAMRATEGGRHFYLGPAIGTAQLEHRHVASTTVFVAVAVSPSGPVRLIPGRLVSSCDSPCNTLAGQNTGQGAPILSAWHVLILSVSLSTSPCPDTNDRGRGPRLMLVPHR